MPIVAQSVSPFIARDVEGFAKVEGEEIKVFWERDKVGNGEIFGESDMGVGRVEFVGVIYV